MLADSDNEHHALDKAASEGVKDVSREGTGASESAATVLETTIEQSSYQVCLLQCLILLGGLIIVDSDFACI